MVQREAGASLPSNAWSLPSDTEVIPRRLTLPVPTAWQPPPTLDDIPPRPSDHSRRNSEAFEYIESPNSLGPRGSAHDSKQSLRNLSPRSARTGSLGDQPDFSDEDLSVTSAIDRGYTAAIDRHRSHSPCAVVKTKLPTELAGVGGHFNSTMEDSLEKLILDSIQTYGDSTSEGAKEWLPVDKLLELVNKDRVYQELLRAFGTEHCRNEPLETDLKAYANKICCDESYTDRTGNTLKTSYRSIFAILTLMQQAQDATEFVDAELSDRYLPLSKQLKANSKGYEFHSSSSPGRTWNVGQTWTNPGFVLFIDFQKFMLSPFFTLRPKEVSFYDLHPHVVLPFIEDGEKRRQRQGYHGSVWPVKIHPAHHDYQSVLLSSFCCI
jgi:hypothetical protein